MESQLILCFSLGYHLSISQALPCAVRKFNREDYLNTKRTDWNKALVDSSVHVFTLLHITYNAFLITVDIDGLWYTLGSAIQAKNCGQNKFLRPDVSLHRPELVHSLSGSGISLHFIIPSWTWEFLLFQVMNLIPSSLASPYKELWSCPTIFDFREEKNSYWGTWQKMTGKNTGTEQAVYRMCKYFSWF